MKQITINEMRTGDYVLLYDEWNNRFSINRIRNDWSLKDSIAYEALYKIHVQKGINANNFDYQCVLREVYIENVTEVEISIHSIQPAYEIFKLNQYEVERFMMEQL